MMYIAEFILPYVSVLNPKLKKFVQGRKNVFQLLQQKIKPSDLIIWIHCASLGEFEQGRPIIENIKILNPNYKIILTFFSPSGYEVRKNYDKADVVLYLPLDTPINTIRFLDVTHPQIAIFIKYEFWANYLQNLHKRNIPTLLISGIFRANQYFFKPYFSWYRNQLKYFTHFFVQDENSAKLLHNIGFQNITISGDTRFDRVFALRNEKTDLTNVQCFVSETKVLIAGSTWPPDEELLLQYIQQSQQANLKFIIVPHDIHQEHINILQHKLKIPSLLFSELNTNNCSEAKVLIVNTVGLLGKLYRFADVAYVGGGFGVGIHNILEPATYGIPIVIGKNYHKFKEAVDLVSLEGCFSVANQQEFNNIVNKLMFDAFFRKQAGNKTQTYVEDHQGATMKILHYIEKLL